jgi:hypothetical protein
VVTPAVVHTASKAKGKVKVKGKLAPKATHPGAGSAAKFHKLAVVKVKATHKVAIAKAHPAAHAKKK